MFDRPKLEHAPVSDPVAPRRKVSREGLVLIKSLEGFQPRASRRPDGRWTLGYGHTRSAREGLTVSEADAELLLQYDLLPVVAALNDRVSRPLNQHQFDALASFALSVGVEAFVTSEVLAALNAEGPEGAARALAASTDVDPALARAGRRRHAEWALFGADPAAPVTVAELLAAPAPQTDASASAPVEADTPAPAPTPAAAADAAPDAASDADVAPSADVPPADVVETPDAAAPVPVETDAPEVEPVALPTAATPPAFSLRYAAAVSHLLGEAPARAAPLTPTAVTPAPAEPVEPLAAPDPVPANPPVAEAGAGTESPPAESGPATEPPRTAADAPPATPPAPDIDRQAVLAELMRRQMSPFAIQVRGPLPGPARAPAQTPVPPPAPTPVAPAPAAAAAPPVPPQLMRPPVAAQGPMTAVLTGPLLLPEPSSEAEAPAAVDAPLPGVDTVEAAVATPPLIEMEAPAVAPLVLTPPPSVEPDVQRPVWSSEERNPPARSLETDLFSEDELAADIGLGPVLRHEVVETPGRRFDFGQLGAYAGMGAVGLVSLGAAVPAAQALFDEGAGPSGETLLVFAALALIGAGCSGISGFNLWRLWREAHARDQAPRDA
ncbi:MAG TPA: glycoside hydrolase family protein [Brevundimonas sp.]|jgi:GH24 family phage-related lysozyme (muramidase)|uniref:lysozyme n=1 Tax=Brevundimonas sp. TaxID=1871086 RepID=UPI002E128EC6|nr:glycoside hydrolase family protein [Brevundimonas sp.]